MLDEFKRHHDAVLTVAREMEELAKAPCPDTKRVADARLKIAKLSNARTRFLETIVYPDLLRHLNTTEAASVQGLRDARLRGLARTADHIAAWGSQRIAAEWPQFKIALEELLHGLRRGVAVEQTVLEPLIARRWPPATRISARTAFPGHVPLAPALGT